MKHPRTILHSLLLIAISLFSLPTFAQELQLAWDAKDAKTFNLTDYGANRKIIIQITNTSDQEIEVRFDSKPKPEKYKIPQNSKITYSLGALSFDIGGQNVAFNEGDKSITIMLNQIKLIFDVAGKTSDPQQKMSIFEQAYQKTFPEQSVRQEAGGSAVLEKVGGLDVTQIADGLAKFMVKRTKQELTAAFFEKFNQELNTYPDVQTLFPRTRTTLGLIGDQIYDYERFLLSLKENFQDDYQALPDNLPNIIPNHRLYFNNHTDLGSALTLGSKIALGIRDKTAAGAILASVTKADIDGFPKQVQLATLLTQFISESFKNTQNKSTSLYWVEAKRLSLLFNNDKLADNYLDLFKEELSAAQPEIYEKVKTHPAGEFVQALKAVAIPALRINALVKNNDQEEITELETIASYTDAVGDLVGAVNEAIQLVSNTENELNLVARKIMPILKSSTSLLGNISQKKYSTALFNTVEIITVLMPQNETDTKKFWESGQALVKVLKKSDDKWKNIDERKLFTDLISLSKTLREAKYSVLYDSQRPEVEAFIKGYPMDDAFLRWLTKYGAFIASIISAENSDQVAEIIETYAMPSGSFSVKRKSQFNIALNSYLGIYAGGANKRGGYYGISAPIGVAFSWGWQSFGSFSIFPSLIDIGAIASFRFKDSESEVGKILLKEIFSPGLFLAFGIGKLPISLNLGSQLAPLLQRVGTTNNDYDVLRHWRFSGSLVVDIPLFNFYNKGKN